jgi:small neutral amino acid transporter SnatA (MarC family)
VGIASAFPEREQSYLFMISLLLTILTFDVLKCAVSYKLKTVLTPKIIHIINKIVGIVLVVVGVYFIISEFIPAPVKF